MQRLNQGSSRSISSDKLDGLIAEINIHISQEDYLANHREIHSTFVNRTSLYGVPLMVTTDVYAIINPGDDLLLTAAMNFTPSVMSSPMHSPIPIEASIDVNAIWYDAETKPAVTAGDANVFGRSGTLSLVDQYDVFSIPLHDSAAISSDFLSYFGATLFSVNTTVHGFNTSPYKLNLVTYCFDESYVSDYVLRADGGGGIFVETHNFPHVFVPMQPECRGGLILGREVGKHQYTFAAFQIPYGYGLHVKEGVIHGDSFFIGQYSISLTEAGSASTVLFRAQDESIQAVNQVSAESMSGLRAIRFFKPTNHIQVGASQDEMPRLSDSLVELACKVCGGA